MKQMERISDLFRAKLPVKPTAQAYKDALEAGRRAKLAEDYPKALEHLERAVELAQDQERRSIATLYRAEVLMQMRRWDEAAQVIDGLYRSAQTDAQLAHIVKARGLLAQARGDWMAARSDYELALRCARNAGALGAEARVLARLGSTYLHEGNASYATHLLREAVTKLNAAGDVEESSPVVGLLGQALVSSGQDVEGQHLLERALSLAESTGSRGYERHWATVLGGRAASEGRFHDAKALYARALKLFDVGTPTVTYITTLCQLSKACLSLRQHEEALDYAETAVHASEGLGDDSVTLLARGTLGVVLRALGRSAEAIPHLQAASADGAQTDVLRSLAAAQSDSGDTDAAIETYKRALAVAQTSEARLELAQVRRDLGLAYVKLGQHQAAIYEWSAALAIYEERKAHAQAARLYCDIAGARKALAQNQRAMKDYEQALMLLSSVDENDLETRGLVLSNAANAFAEQGDVESADAFFNEAITLADRLGDQAAESTRCGNYGRFLLLVGRPRRAMANLERALQLSKAVKLRLHTAVQTDNLGLVYDALGDYATALDYHRQALQLAQEVGDGYWQAMFRINQGNTLLSLAHIDDASSLFDVALAYGREQGRVEIVVAALTGAAQVALGRRQLASASTAIDEAIALARKADFRRLLADALLVRSHYYALAEQSQDALSAWEEAQKLYAMLHMPQAKTQPAWLTRPHTPA